MGSEESQGEGLLLVGILTLSEACIEGLLVEQYAVPELCTEKAARHTVHLPNQKPVMHQALTFSVSLVPHFQTKCQV